MFSNLVTVPPSDQSWADLIAENPRANLFHHPAWVHMLAACYGYRPFIIAVQDTAGRLGAGIPMMEISSRLNGRRWVSLPFTDYCEPLYRDSESLYCLTEHLVSLARKQQVSRVELRWELPSHPMIHPYSQYMLHCLKLDPNVKQLESNLHRMHRQNIRTAEKRGVRVERGEKRTHLQAFYELQVDTRRRHGMPVQPRHYFESLAGLMEQGLGFVLLAYKDDQCIAGVVFLHWNRSLIAKYAASRSDSLNLRPNDLLFWTAIRWGCENGYTRFDMGRTDVANTGLCEFKTRWGAEQTPLIYSALPAAPRTTDGKLMTAMQAVIRRAPPWVCQAVGEVMYKHFG